VLELIGEAGGAVWLVVHQERALHGDADGEATDVVFAEISRKTRYSGCEFRNWTRAQA